jgi:hypothetical protein
MEEQELFALLDGRRSGDVFASFGADLASCSHSLCGFFRADQVVLWFVSGSFEEGFAECEVPFGRREVQQGQKSRILPYRRGGIGYGGRHDLDQVSIAAAIEVAKRTVAPIMLPADEVYGVYGRRLVGRIAMSDSTVIAVDRETQWPGRIPIVGRPACGHVYFPPSKEESVRLLSGSPYLAIHLLEERIALLVALLVIAH